MMTISPIKSASAASQYFQDRSKADKAGEYYLDGQGKGGEPAGKWHDAEALGLAGEITGNELSHVLEGRDPRTREMLVQAGKEHRPGWDVTLSAPKSVSAVWAIAPDDLRRQIEQAHTQAGAEAKQYLDARAAFTRRGHAGKDHEPVRLVTAEYQHSCSRNEDPQLHSHLLVMNLARRTDGTWGSIESRYLMMHQLAVGTIYQLSLANQLERMGFSIQPGRGGTFDVAGVPANVLKTWSSRHEEIATEMEKAGVTRSRGTGAQIAVHETRRSKTYTDPSLLRQRWTDQAAALGWGPDQVQALLARESRPEPPGQVNMKPIRWKDMDSEKSLIREIGAGSYGRASAAEVRALAEEVARDWRNAQVTGRELAYTVGRRKPAEKPPAVRLDEATRAELRERLAGLGKKIPAQDRKEKLPGETWQQARDTAVWLTQASPALASAVNQAVEAAEKAGRTPDEARRYVESQLAGTMTQVARGVAQQERRSEILDLAVGPAWKTWMDGPAADVVRSEVNNLLALSAKARGQAAAEATRRIMDSPAIKPLVDDYVSREKDPGARDKLAGRVATGLLAAADYTDRRSDAVVSRGISAALAGLLQTVRQEELAAERLAAEEEAARKRRAQLEQEMSR